MASENDSVDMNVTIRLQVTDPVALKAFAMTELTDERTGELVIPEPLGGQQQEILTALGRMLMAADERFGPEAGLRFFLSGVHTCDPTDEGNGSTADA